MRQKLTKGFMNLKISSKILIYYLVVLILSTSISTFLYGKISKKIIEEKVGEVSMQTIQSISSNIDLLVDTVNNQSKILLSNQTLQTTLSKDIKNITYEDQRILNRYLTEFLNFNPLISSIYVVDNYNNRYYVDNEAFKSFDLNYIKKMPWYDDIIKQRGTYSLKLNALGESDKTEKNYISLIRVVNSLETQNPIGIMIINISENAFIKSYANVSKLNNTTIAIKDENDREIVKPQMSEIIQNKALINSAEDNEDDSVIRKVNGKLYLISHLKYQYNWKIISMMPFEELSKESNRYSVINLFIIVVNGVLIFIGSIVISRLITKPIQKLVKSMEIVEKGEFREVMINTGNDEIGKLRDVYNTMIREIQKLFNKVIEEQKIKRKAELDVLQAQIKPHFLYNSFDAISSLALCGRADDVYTLIKALGSFYRTSLSNGREVITIGEELQTVKNYITIQKIRYPDMFDVIYEIDERTIQYKTLKLVLQPLVENAIYHGIKCKEDKGTIKIKTIYNRDSIQLIVEDDGAGMDEEQILKLENGETQGIGVRATIERLRIFYGAEDVFKVSSRKNKGTTITISIPIMEERDYGK